MATIAIIDDSRYMRLLLEESLRQTGHEDIFSFGSASDFFTWLEKEGNQLDLLLLDWMLPESDGLEVVEKINNEFALLDLPVLMVTAKSEPEDLRKAFEAGCMDYVKKPLEEIELQARVKSALELKKALDKQKEQLQELEKLARTDSLTGLANKREFTRVLEKEWDRSFREGYTLALVMIDVDYFKPYNDTYGHEAGDRVLERIAGVIEDVIRRPADCAARYGGEEFALILPATDLSGGENVAARAKDSIEKLGIEHNSRPSPEIVTASFGVCSSDQVGVDSSTDLVKLSDRALYRAKEKGRNRICVWNQVEEHDKF